jgi:pilus assembly protein Flp/PilA
LSGKAGHVSIRNIALSFVSGSGPTSYFVARNLGSVAMRIATRLLSDKRGVGAIEYALVASLISIAALAGYQTLGNKMEKTYSSVDHAVQGKK